MLLFSVALLISRWHPAAPYPKSPEQIDSNHIRITTIPYMYISMRTYNTTSDAVEYSGLCFDVMNLFVEKYNLTYSVQEPDDNQWGLHLENDTWTGMIGQLAKNEVDIAISDFTLSYERSKVVDFTAYYAHDAIVLISKSKDSVLFRIFRPFQSTVWFLGVLSLCIFSACSFGIYSLSKPTMADLVSALHWVFSIFGLHWGQSVNDAMLANVSVRIVFLAFMGAIFFMIASYNSNLKAIFTVDKISKRIRSLQEALDITDMQFITAGGTNFLQTIQDSHGPLYRKLWSNIKGNPGGVIPYSEMYSQGYEMVRQSDNMAVIYSENHAKIAIATTYPDLYIAKQFVAQHGSHFAMRKSFPHAHLLSRFIQNLVEAGVIEQWEERYQSKFSDDITPSYVSAIKLSQIYDVLLILVCGCAASMMVLLLEVVIVRLRNVYQLRESEV